jgi:hypothetical protein
MARRLDTTAVGKGRRGSERIPATDGLGKGQCVSCDDLERFPKTPGAISIENKRISRSLLIGHRGNRQFS